MESNYNVSINVAPSYAATPAELPIPALDAVIHETPGAIHRVKKIVIRGVLKNDVACRESGENREDSSR